MPQKTENAKEPTLEEIKLEMQKTGYSDFDNTIEKLRKLAYCKKPPNGFSSCGIYWESY